LCTGSHASGIPESVEHAAYLAAALGIADRNAIVIGGVNSMSEGSLSISFSDGGGAFNDGFARSPMIDAMLRCLLEPRIPVRLV